MNTILSESLRLFVPKIAKVSLKPQFINANHVKYRLYYTACLKRNLYQDETDRHQKKINTNIPKLTKNIYTSIPLFSAITVKAPVFPDSVSDGDLRWKKKEGDSVTADEVIAEIETDKVALPVPAPSSGTIKKLLAQEGDQVKSEAALCTIEAK